MSKPTMSAALTSNAELDREAMVVLDAMLSKYPVDGDEVTAISRARARLRDSAMNGERMARECLKEEQAGVRA